MKQYSGRIVPAVLLPVCSSGSNGRTRGVYRNADLRQNECFSQIWDSYDRTLPYTQRRVMPYRGHTSAGLRVFLAGFVTFTGPAAGSVIFSSPFATVQSPNGQSRLIAVADGNFHTRGTAIDRRCLVPRRKDESATLEFSPPEGNSYGPSTLRNSRMTDPLIRHGGLVYIR